jgi:hypothetical protein
MHRLEPCFACEVSVAFDLWPAFAEQVQHRFAPCIRSGSALDFSSRSQSIHAIVEQVQRELEYRSSENYGGPRQTHPLLVLKWQWGEMDIKRIHRLVRTHRSLRCRRTIPRLQTLRIFWPKPPLAQILMQFPLSLSG